MKRVFEAFGSSSNLAQLTLADRQLNQIKGALMGLGPPLKLAKFENLLFNGAGRNVKDAMKWKSYIKKVIFYYFI